MNNNARLKLVIADDHTMFREGLRKLLEESNVDIVGEASDGLEAIKLVESILPDILVVDINMPSMNGIEVTRRITKQFPQIKVVVLSMYGDDSYVIEALRAGAMAYVLKVSSTTDLIKAIHAAICGQHYLSAFLSERAIESYMQHITTSEKDPFDSLSIREKEVMQMTVQGMSSREISEKLFISHRTVDIHRTHIMHKLGLRNKMDLVQVAQRRGMMPSDRNS